jgi:DNA-binding XRE family transcriptional regulator
VAEQRADHRGPPRFDLAGLRAAGWPTLTLTLRKTLLMLTLEEMSRLVGVTCWTYMRWEHGHRPPSLRNQKRLLDLLELTLRPKP